MTVEVVSESTARFLEFVAKRRKPATHRFYAGRLVAFDKMLGRKKLHKLKKADCESYLEYANKWQTTGLPKAPDTIRGNISAFEQWQKFAVREDHLRKPLLDDLEKPAGRNRERLPTPEEVELIKSVSSPEFNRVYEALRRCGARPGEISRATVADWDKVEGMIVLKEHKTDKTGQLRRIAVGEKLAALILESLAGRTEGLLFLTPRGRAWNTNSIGAAFRRARNMLNLDRQLVRYTTRHEHGTAVYHAHGELAAATALGHKGTGMIHRYAKIAPATRRETQDSLAM